MACCCSSADDQREQLLKDNHGGRGTFDSKTDYTMLAPTLSEEGLPHYKVTVLGSGGVGKSALTLRLVSGKFQQEYDPTIEDSYRLKEFIPNEFLNIDFSKNSTYRSNGNANNNSNNNTRNNTNRDLHIKDHNRFHASSSGSGRGPVKKSTFNSKYNNRNLNSADLDGQLISMEILDTAGQEEFVTLRDQWINHSDGFLLVYSVDSKASLEETTKIFSLIEKHFEDEIEENYNDSIQNGRNSNSNGSNNNGGVNNGVNLNKKQNFVLPCVLAGNKCDLYEKEREIDFSQGQTFANTRLRGIPFFETSAKDQINNKECFYEIIRLIQMNLKWKYREELEYQQRNQSGGCNLL